MKKIHVVKQRDFKDCGVCSMLSIIKHYNGNVSLEKLRELTNTNIDGTTAYNIVYGFRKIGFDSYAMNVDNINNGEIKFPVIAHMLLANGCYHFVVVYNLSKNKITLMDPDEGKKIMNISEFNDLFTGNIIIAIPKDKEVIKESDTKIENIIIKFIRKERKIVMKIIVLSIIFSILSILLGYSFKIFSYNLNDKNNLIKIIFIFLGFVILKELISYSKNYYKNYLNLRIDVTMFEEFISHIFFLPLKNIKSRSTGEVMSRIKELEFIKEIFSDIFVTLFLDLLLAIISLIVLFIINVKLTIILLIIILIYILFGILVNKAIYIKIMKNINYETELNSKLIEYINMITSIKNLNVTKNILTNLENNICIYIKDSFEFNNFYNLITFIKNYILEIGFFIINSFGFIQVFNNNFTLINLITFNLLINYSIEPIKNIIELLPKYNHIKIILLKITEFLSIEKEQINYNNNLKLKGNIVVENISYSYNNYTNIINNLNFSIEEKDKVFLKGNSGSGKSTLCNLLYKNLELSNGNIKVDNFNIKDLDIDIIRNNILYVNQDETILNGTIKENVVLDRDIDSLKFIEICNICCIEEILNKKNARYNAMVDPFNKNISGGEKQRIILARGLLKDANIIILDEALSEVDYDLEEKIIKNILEYFKDKTIVYISHKDHSNLFDYMIDIGDDNEKIL